MRKIIRCTLAILLLIMCACTKEFDVEPFLGQYDFSIAGRASAYELKVEEGSNPQIVNTDEVDFIVGETSGSIQTYRITGTSVNELSFLMKFNDGSSIIVNALVNRANGIDLMRYTQVITLYDEKHENVMYHGPVTIDGEGGLVDNVLSLNLRIQSVIETSDKFYGYFVSNIMLVANKK